MKNKHHKSAIVTGGSRGIGKRIAERLAAENYAVVIGYRTAREEADAVVTGIKQAGGAAHALCKTYPTKMT